MTTPSRITRLNPSALHATPGYHHVTIVEAGRTAHLAGQCPLDERGALVGANDLSAQTRQVVANALTALDAIGAAPADISPPSPPSGAAADPARPGLERYVVLLGGEVRGTAIVSEIAGYAGALRVQIKAEDDQAWRFAADALADELRGRTGRLLAIVRHDHPDSVRFVAAGYRLGWESWGACLKLPPGGLASDAYAEFIEGPRAAGYVARELVLPADAGHVHEAFELYVAGLGDFPRTPATSVEEYDERGFLEHVARGRLFAVIHAGRCVAITVFEAGATAAEVETDFTLVGADHRGKGLAGFLKAAAIERLADEGVRIFRTGGAVVNEPMLRTNVKLGYVLEPFWGSYELALGG